MDFTYDLKDLDIRIIDNNLARQFIIKYHYSGTCPNLSFAFGAFYKNEIKNVIGYSSPIGRMVAQEVLQNGDSDNTLELIRMVSIEPKPRNLESYCIHKTFDFLKHNFKQYKVIVSYADNTVGHHGYVYQASGFTYYGQSRPTKEWYLDGTRIHERNLNNTYGSSSYEFLKEKLGDRIEIKINEKTKSKYYYLIYQNKKEKKELLKKVKVKSLPYPKGINKKYDVFNKNDFVNLNGEKSSNKDKEIEYNMSIFDFIEKEI